MVELSAVNARFVKACYAGVHDFVSEKPIFLIQGHFKVRWYRKLVFVERFFKFALSNFNDAPVAGNVSEKIGCPFECG